MKRPLRFGIALALGLSLTAAILPFELVLKEKDHEKIGDSLVEYYDAIKEKKGITEARNEVRDVLDKFSAKLSKKAKKDVDVLSLTEDMTAAFMKAASVPSRATVGKITDFSVDTPLGKMDFTLHAPKKYKASKGSVPLIITIPEEGKDLSDHLNENWMLGDVRDGAVIAALKMPRNVDLWAKSSRDPMGGLEVIMFSLGNILKEYAIDPNRIYISGRGDGVEAAAHVASIFPYTFAGLIGRSGDLSGTGPKNFGNVHCYFAGGGGNVTDFQDKAKDLGYETVTVEPAGDLKAIWTWIEAHPRIANPSKIDFELKSPMAARAYWLSAAGFDPEEEPAISAEINRETNAIAITASNVSEVTLYFNDALVDLDREVKVICNGVEQKEKFSRSLATALTQFYNSNDAGRVYTAFQVYDIPELEDK